MEIITYNNTDYILGTAVTDNLKYYLRSLGKIPRNPKEFVTENNIPENNYIYLRLKNNEYVVGEKYSAKFDKLWFKKSYYDELDNINKELIKQEEEEIAKTPPILELEDCEKFRSKKNIVLEIETRGVREVKGIFFSVDDVSEIFKNKELKKTVRRETTTYKENIDYVFFTTCIEGDKLPDNTSIKKMYFTYEGMLRFLFVSNNKKTLEFIEWATETLFIAQMGTKEQKYTLAANAIGVTSDVVKQVFDTNVFDVPCTYLLSLGTVKDLRKSMNIGEEYADNVVIYKYGRTNKMERRIREHEKTYGKIKGCKITLKSYCYIDVTNASQAEKELKDYIEGHDLNFTYENHSELVIMDKKREKMVIQKMEQIGEKYMGRLTGLITKIKMMEEKTEKLIIDHEKEIERLKENHKNEMEIKDKNHEIAILKMEAKHEKEISAIGSKQEKEKCDNIVEIMTLKNDILRKEMECCTLANKLFIKEEEIKVLKNKNEELTENVVSLKDENMKLKKKTKTMKKDD